MMTENTSTFEEQATKAAVAVVNILTAITPLFLITLILGIATFNGWLEYIYYYAVIGSMAWIPGFLFAFMRFGSGLGGINLFKSGYTMQGLFFLLVSIGMTFWTSSHVPKMGEALAVSEGMATHAAWLFRYLLWVALIGEVMIAVYMYTHRNATPQQNNEQDAATPERTTLRNVETVRFEVPSRNGNGQAYNSATPTPQRQQIGFQLPTLQKAATPASPVTNEVSGPDGYLVAEELDKARNNLRAYRSKLRNGNGNPETLRRGVQRWEARVAELEAQLQQ